MLEGDFEVRRDNTLINRREEYPPPKPPSYVRSADRFGATNINRYVHGPQFVQEAQKEVGQIYGSANARCTDGRSAVRSDTTLTYQKDELLPSFLLSCSSLIEFA